MDDRVYRRADGTPDDSKSALELGRYKGLPPAQRAGLSCFLDVDALREAMSVHQKWASSGVVFADLKPPHGMIAKTGKDHHHSLWLRRAALAMYSTLFQKL